MHQVAPRLADRSPPARRGGARLRARARVRRVRRGAARAATSTTGQAEGTAAREPSRAERRGCIECVTDGRAGRTLGDVRGRNERRSPARRGWRCASTCWSDCQRTQASTSSAPPASACGGAAPGVKVYTYFKQVTNLSAPAIYRGAVRFRWLSAKGHILKMVSRHLQVSPARAARVGNVSRRHRTNGSGADRNDGKALQQQRVRPPEAPWER